MIDNLNSPLWKRALLAANGEIPIKVIKFVNDLIAEANIQATQPLSSIARPEDDVAQLRDKVESLNRELFDAELQLDVLWRAMTLSKKNIQRVVEERADTISRINKRRTLPQVPKEIILKIAGYLPWNDSYDDEGLTPVRRMARAFSAVRGMEDAILRKLPLVVQHLPPSHWNCSDAYLPKGYMDIIGSRPRICRYDDEDTISRVTRNEEVYLTLPSESHASNISTAAFQRLAAGRLHLSLIDSTAHGFRDFKTSFLNQKILPRITSLIVQRDSGRYAGRVSPVIHTSSRPVDASDTSVLGRARFSLWALQDYLPAPQHLTILEITFPSDLENLDALIKVLRTISSSLQSLHLVGYSSRKILYKGRAFGTGAMPTVVFPDLQELGLDTLHVVDAFALLNTVNCPSLASLRIGRLEVDLGGPASPTGAEPAPESIMFAEKIINKFPQLSRLAYAPGREENAFIYRVKGFAFHEYLLHLLDERRCLDIGSAHRVWLLPRLQQLEVEVTENEVELLIPLVSARLASPDAANIRTVHLQVLNQDLCYGESEDDASSHLNSLRLLVPEVVYEKLPPRD